MSLSAIKDDPKFNISFVQCVQKWQCLYNYSLKEYNNKDEQDKAWMAVALEMNCPVAACKERWKNLRASLCRHLRHQVNGSNSRAKRPYYLAEYMQFVMPYTKIRNIKGGFSQVELTNMDVMGGGEGDMDDPMSGSCADHNGFKTEDDSFGKTEEDFFFQEDPTVLHEDAPQPQVNSSSSCASSSSTELLKSLAGSVSCSPVNETPTLKRKTVDHPMELCELEYSTVATKRRPKDDEGIGDDPDLLFMRSLIPDMKKMTDRDKNHFKRNILAMIDQILYSHSQPPSPRPKYNKIPQTPD